MAHADGIRSRARPSKTPPARFLITLPHGLKKNGGKDRMICRLYVTSMIVDDGTYHPKRSGATAGR